MKEITLSVPHAILFVNDPAHEHVVIPEYVPGRITSANVSCVSVNTRADVDGEVTVRLGATLLESMQDPCNTVVEHVIETPRRSVGVFTSENEMVLAMEVRGETTRLTIAVDDSQSPGIVCIAVQ